MKVEIVVHETVEEAIWALADVDRRYSVFRGHSDQNWSLRPSLFRDEFEICKAGQSQENVDDKTILKQAKLIGNKTGADFSKVLTLFYRSCVERGVQMPQISESVHARLMGSSRPLSQTIINNKGGPSYDMNTWPIIALMQHYGFKTPMLDWSRNPLVALFFATEGSLDADGCVWQFSDLPLAILPAASNVDPSTKSFIEGQIGQLFAPTATPFQSDCGIFLERPKFSSNERLIAQDGWLSISLFNCNDCIGDLSLDFNNGLDAFDFLKIYTRFLRQIDKGFPKNSTATTSDAFPVKKHIIPAALKSKIISRLNSLRVDRLSVYPGLTHVHSYIKEFARENDKELFTNYFE